MRKSLLRQIVFGGASAPSGQEVIDTPGTGTWTVPDGVNSVCVVCVGPGANGENGSGAESGAGGGTGYKNNISVTPGTSINYRVGAGGSGLSTYFVNSATVEGRAGVGTAGGGFTGDGGGNGGNGFFKSGGGGAGGYSGDGGDGGSTGGSDGIGGGGASGGRNDNSPLCGDGGGGVGLLGQNSSGIAPAGGGSGGGNGDSRTGSGDGGNGGLYGGGGGAADSVVDTPGAGANGAIRIIWGPDRAFPATNTQDM